jgi:hypothetical protein
MAASATGLILVVAALSAYIIGIPPEKIYLPFWYVSSIAGLTYQVKGILKILGE